MSNTNQKKEETVVIGRPTAAASDWNQIKAGEGVRGESLGLVLRLCNYAALTGATNTSHLAGLHTAFVIKQISLTLVSRPQSRLRKKTSGTKEPREFLIVCVLFCWLNSPSGCVCGAWSRPVSANPPLTGAICGNQQCLQSSRFKMTVEEKNIPHRER